MQTQHPNIIVHALEGERRAFNNGGWAWVVFSLVAQCSLLVWLHRMQPLETSVIVVFFVLSLLFAWWPLLRGIRQLRRAHALSRPNDLLRRALTSDPQLIAWLKLGTHKTIWIRLLNLVETLVNSTAHAAQNSWDQYGITGSGETADNRLPCVVLKLADGQEHRLTTTRDDAKLKELIDALLAHAPHAAHVPETVPTKGHLFIESVSRGWLRPTMFLLGGPLMMICSLLLFAQYMDARERAELEQHGVRTTATVSGLSDYGGKGSDYNVAVEFTDRNGKTVKAGTVKLVSKTDYEQLGIGAPVEIFYKQQDPKDFRLALSLQRLDNDKSLFIAFSILSLIGFIMVLIGVVSAMTRKKRVAITNSGGGDYVVNPRRAA